MANFNINKAVIGGRLTGDVELKQTGNGIPVCGFTIAVSRKTNREEADFISCQAWRKTAEFISRYFRKGSSICVTGAIQTRSWTDSNNNKRYSTELVVDEAYFVDSKSDAESDNAPIYEDQKAPQYEELSGDDDLPF